MKIGSPYANAYLTQDSQINTQWIKIPNLMFITIKLPGEENEFRREDLMVKQLWT